MKKTEKRKSTSEYTYVIEQTCDLCGTKAIQPGNCWDSGSSFDVGETEIEVTIRQKDGSNYPEGGSGTEINVDMCPKCFKEKLVPWLQSQGAKVESKYWDW